MPTTYLNRVMLTIPDDLNNAVKQQAAARHISPEALIIDFIRLGLGLEPSQRLSADIIREKLAEEMNLYATQAINGIAILTQTADQSVFAVVGIGQVQQKRFANASLIARLVDNTVIIDLDQNDKPLVDALMQAGIPRAQIVLAYADEPIPETA